MCSGHENTIFFPLVASKLNLQLLFSQLWITRARLSDQIYGREIETGAGLVTAVAPQHGGLMGNQPAIRSCLAIRSERGKHVSQALEE